MARRTLMVLLSFGIALLVVFCVLLAFMTMMPGRSYAGPLSSLSPNEVEIRDRLQSHVRMLAGTIGARNVIANEELQAARRYIEDSLKLEGYQVQSQEYTVQMRKVANLIAEIRGTERPDEIVVIGAHYDTVYESPGADDNSSGIAGLLELARLLRDKRPARTVRFVAFVNEEPPWFKTEDMGSWVYAREAHQRKEKIVSMLSLETIGMYSDEEGSQQYPPGLGLLYPKKGNFIGFVGNLSSRSLVRQAVGAFRATTQFPSEGSAAPEAITGVGWSDQWSFWQEGYPAIMVTDTAPFRNPNYHEPNDTLNTLDYERMARVVLGLSKVAERLGR